LSRNVKVKCKIGFFPTGIQINFKQNNVSNSSATYFIVVLKQSEFFLKKSVFISRLNILGKITPVYLLINSDKTFFYLNYYIQIFDFQEYSIDEIVLKRKRLTESVHKKKGIFPNFIP